MRLILLTALLALAACSQEPGVDLPPIDAGGGPEVSVADVGVDDASSPYVRGEQALDYVDPFIGTGGIGFAYASMTPAVQTPLGFVKVGPDTTRSGSHPSELHHFSGYYWPDPDIRGFSHLHFVGTGAADYGNLRFAVGDDSKLDRFPEDWWTEKVEGSEVAEPGYYKVELADGTTAEMTARKHAAVHRYSIPAGGLLAIDPTSSVTDRGVEDAQVAVNGDQVNGQLTYAGSYIGRKRPFTLYFSIKLSDAPTTVSTWTQAGYTDSNTASGPVAGAVIRWDGQIDVEARVGLSFISPEMAEQHRAEVDELTFEAVQAQTRAQWADLLGRVELADGTETERTIFYTALYNSFRMPTRLDENGQYRGIDGEVHPVDHAYYTDLSLWDTYRTLHPLWTLIAPDLQRDVLRSLNLMGRDGGYIPRWPAALSYTGGMEGDSAAILFAEGALKGIDGVDYAAAFDRLLLTADGPGDPEIYGGREGIEPFLELGWVPADEAGGGASNTLEYSIDDNALANLAAHLGRDEDEARFRDRATWYENVWDDETKFFRPRNRDGSFVEPFSPTAFEGRSGDFTEGTGWHWRFYVPHDPDGLAELFGGPEALAAELETFMSESRLWQGDPTKLAIPDSYYWHTNQPSLHVPFLFGAIGQWDRLQHWVGLILENAYFSTPDGLVGNDDGGTLSSWYVLASLGIYPVVGTDRWIVFEPKHIDARIDGARITWSDEPHRIVSHGALFE